MSPEHAADARTQLAEATETELERWRAQLRKVAWEDGYLKTIRTARKAIADAGGELTEGR